MIRFLFDTETVGQPIPSQYGLILKDPFFPFYLEILTRALIVSCVEIVDFIPIHRYRPNVSINELQEYEQSVKLFGSSQTF